jgi:hypothetical protein
MLLLDDMGFMKLRIIILIAIAGCAACNRDQGSSAPVATPKPKPGVHAPASSQRGPDAQQLTAGMVEAVTQGKTQAPMDLKFDLLERPIPGEPLEVALALLPQTDARSATIAVTGSDGLTLDPGEGQFEFAAIEAAQVYRHRIIVTPSGEGLYLLTLTVSLQHDLTSDSRVFSVPILVGPAAAAGAASAAGPAAAAGASASPGGGPPGGPAHQADPPHRGS